MAVKDQQSGQSGKSDSAGASQQGRQSESVLPIRDKNVEDVETAHQQADADIEADPDLNNASPNDDLDEGETARLGEGENPLI